MSSSLYLPEELIQQIVINLPLKSMVRFTCVSKSWQSEVSLQLESRSRKRFALSKCSQKLSRIPLVTHGQKPIQLLTLFNRHVHRSHPVQIVGSCNGLICAVVRLSGLTTGDCSLGRQYDIILWNPATDKLKELPSSFENKNLLKRVLETQHGFGYDASNDDYKVVESIWISTLFGRKRWLKIYSLNSNSWRFISRNASSTMGRSGVLVKGSIHWQTPYPVFDINFKIIAVNLTTETCTIMAPPSVIDSRGFANLGVLEDRLCLAYYDNGYVDYWVMNEYGAERTWTKIGRAQHGRRYPRGNKVPELDEGSDKSHEEWSVEKVCQFHEIPSTIDYIRFRCETYSESLVSLSPPDHVKAKAPRRKTKEIKRFLLPCVLVILAYCIFLVFDLYRSF